MRLLFSFVAVSWFVLPAWGQPREWLDDLATVAAILTLARFCEPSSERHIEDAWYRRTAPDDLLGVRVEQVHTRRLYEGLDTLLPHKEAIEKHLKGRLGDLFDVKHDLLLYDVTSTCFEAECRGRTGRRRSFGSGVRIGGPKRRPCTSGLWSDRRWV